MVLERIRILASDPGILTSLVSETNRQLRTELPKLEERQAALEREHRAVHADADGLLRQLPSLGSETGGVFVAERLDNLAERRRGLQNVLTELDEAIGSIRRQAVDEGVVREAMTHIGEVYEALPPYRRKDLIRLVLDRAQVSETRLRLDLKGRPPTVEVLRGRVEPAEMSGIASRSETSKWLGGLMSQSPIVVDLAGLQAARGLWYVLRLRLAA